MIKLEINKENNTVIIQWIEYPPTKHNLKVWRWYKSTGDEELLRWLSTVVLDLTWE